MDNKFYMKLGQSKNVFEVNSLKADPNLTAVICRDEHKEVFCEEHYKKGKLVKQITPFRENEADSTVYLYNSAGKLKEKVFKEFDKKHSNFYFYDSEGKLSRKVDTEYEMISKFSFTDLYGHEVMNDSDEVVSHHEFQYDINGNLIYEKETWLNHRGFFETTDETWYLYDSNNLLVFEKQEDWEKKNHYDRNGKLVRSDITDFALEENHIIIYKYDSYNRLVKKICDNERVYTYEYFYE